jgi:hypothetical protein
MTDDPALREEIRSAVEARRELSDEMEPALIDNFVARIEKRLGEQDRADQWALEQKRNHQKEMVLGSMAISIPLFALAAVFAGLPGIVVVCVTLVAIAVATAR